MAETILLIMYDTSRRIEACVLVTSGRSLSAASRATGIARSTIRSWMESPERPSRCCRCAGAWPTRGADYSALLGYYLGDGCISIHRGHTTFRVSCDTAWSGVIEDVSSLVQAVQPSHGVFHVRAPGTTVVQANGKHWPCVFPQHGPGRKHERKITLEDWQSEMVTTFPGDFLRGLFHSDGARVNNWATRVVAGEKRRYDYPRWQFSNRSEDILHLCGWALDLADVAWRRSGPWTVSVSRRQAVATLDALIGLKS